MIEINVGGKTFITELSTLMKYEPNRFSREFKKASFDSSLIVNIDRDPEIFTWILRFLRGYTLTFEQGPLANKQMQLNLFEDAEFFELRELQALILAYLDPQPTRGELIVKLIEVDEQFSEANIDTESTQIKPVDKIIDSPYEVIQQQIRFREASLKDWKLEKYSQDCLQMIITICSYLEMIAPSTFICGLAKTVYEKIQQKGELYTLLQDSILEYIHDEKDSEELSSMWKFILSIISIVFVHGLSQNEKENPLKSIIDNYTTLF